MLGIQPIEYQCLQITKKIINMTSSLAILCMQHGLMSTASAMLLKGFKADLVLHEIRDHQLMNDRILNWIGRV